MFMMIDQKPAFEIYHDPEPLELASSAPQESLASTRPPPLLQTSLQQQNPPSGFSHASSVSRLSPSPAGSFLTDGARVVLGELPLKTTFNPFHRHQSHGYGSSCRGRRLRPTTCDSRLKHETKLRSSSPPSPNAAEHSSEDLGGDDDDDVDCHNRQAASRIPPFKSRSTRRSTISSTQIPQNGQLVVAQQYLRKTSLPSSISETRNGIIMKHRLSVPCRSSSENLSSSPSPAFSLSRTLPYSASSPDGCKRCPQLHVEEETKENLPPSIPRKYSQGRLKKPHSHYQAGAACCQNFPMIRNSSYSTNHCHSRQGSLLSSSHLGPARPICSTSMSNVTREDRLAALGDSASRDQSPSSSPLADRRAPRSFSLSNSRHHLSGDTNPCSSTASAPPDPTEDRQPLHHRNRSLPSFLMRI